MEENILKIKKDQNVNIFYFKAYLCSCFILNVTDNFTLF